MSFLVSPPPPSLLAPSPSLLLPQTLEVSQARAEELGEGSFGRESFMGWAGWSAPAGPLRVRTNGDLLSNTPPLHSPPLHLAVVPV